MPPETKRQRLIDDLTRRIAAGEFPPGSRLPSRSRLAEEYGVSTQTARDATRELRMAGLVEAVPRGGIYVKRQEDA